MHEDGRASGAHPETHPLYAPGLKRRPRKGKEARYWLPRPKDIEAGYPIKSLTIRDDASELECAAICRKHQADLAEWRGGGKAGPVEGTWGWAVKRYRAPDAPSRYHQIGEQTRRQYDYFCDLIVKHVGERTIAGTTGEDLMRWYDELKKSAPATDDASAGKPRLMRARGTLGQIRRIAKYALFIGHKPAAHIVDLFDKEVVTFQTGRARETVPTPEQVLAITQRAIEDGYRSIAITTLAQFEFTERRVSIIGKYERKNWLAGWVWDSVIDGVRQGITANWTVTYFQNKVGRKRREYDLKDTPLLLELLQQTPKEERTGPVVVCEDTGQPWKARDYSYRFRKIARAVGIPDDVWSMDMRAGGATESDSIVGLSMKDLQASGGWTNAQTVSRYTRDHIRAAQNVVKLRQAARRAK